MPPSNQNLPPLPDSVLVLFLLTCVRCCFSTLDLHAVFLISYWWMRLLRRTSGFRGNFRRALSGERGSSTSSPFTTFWRVRFPATSSFERWTRGTSNTPCCSLWSRSIWTTCVLSDSLCQIEHGPRLFGDCSHPNAKLYKYKMCSSVSGGRPRCQIRRRFQRRVQDRAWRADLLLDSIGALEAQFFGGGGQGGR